MRATLTVVRFRDIEPEHPISVSFGAEGGSLGRGRSNQLVLPDPRRWVSNDHARIQWHEHAFVIIDQSRNGTFLRSALHRAADEPAQRLEKGKAVVLHPGDQIMIGHYELRFDVGGSGEGGRSAPRRGRAARAARPDQGLEEPTQMIGFDDADDADDAPTLVGPNAVGAPERGANAPVDGLEPDAPALPTGSGRAPRRPGVREQRGRGPGSPRELDARARARAATPRSTTSEPQARTRPPTRPAADAAAAPVGQGQGAHAGTADLAEVFIKAIGLESRAELPIGGRQLMATAGAVLRRLTNGLIRTLARQQRTREQLGLPAAGASGPLGLDQRLEDSLALLLMNPELGPAAADGAFAQLHRHEEAILEAVRFGVAAQIARLDPALFKPAKRNSVADALTPWAADARAWKRYVRAHSVIQAQLQADPVAALGTGFAEIYRRALTEPSRRKRPQSPTPGERPTGKPHGGEAG